MIINPVAGKGTGKMHWPLIAKLLEAGNINFEHVFSEYKAHIKAIISESVNNSKSNFLICGGDGSLSEAVNAAMNFPDEIRKKIIFGLLPVGSGNDWCRTHNISTNLKIAIGQFVNGTINQHDVGIIETIRSNQKHYFINIAGTGYDGYVVKRINEKFITTKPSKIIYFAMLLRYLFGYKALLANIITENLVIAEPVFSMSAAICKYNGGGMLQAPQAVFNDGLLTVNIIKKLNLMQVIINLKGLKDGSYVKHKKVVSCQTKNVTVCGEKLNIEADGESLGMAPAVFGVVHNAVKVVLPKMVN